MWFIQYVRVEVQYSHAKPKLVFLAITIEANAQEVVVTLQKSI